MATKSVLNAKVKESDVDAVKARIDKAELIAKAKGFTINNQADLLMFLLDNLESENEKLTPRETNVGRISSLVEAQMQINKTDNAIVKMQNGETVAINKRRITWAFIESTLGCSPTAVKAWIKDQSNVELLEKHHKACGLSENHNRSVARAQKSLERNLSELTQGELINVIDRI